MKEISHENTILHIDMDAFYASVEQRDQPAYQNKPIIVGGTSSRGVVSSASYEARACGVKSAMPIITAKKLCPQAICIFPNMLAYQNESKKILAIMHRYTPLVEPLSLDEAYLEVGGSRKLFGNAETIGKKIQTEIQNELKLSCSVGVASNKFLAKIASEMKKPKGFFVLDWENRNNILDPLPITAIGGIGKKTAEIIKALGIHTIKEFRITPLHVLQTCLGKQAEIFLKLANGEDNRPVTLPQSASSIGREHTFAEDIYLETELHAHLLQLTDEVASRVRKNQQLAHTITVKIKYADFTLVTRSQTIDGPTHQTKEIYELAKTLLSKIKDIRKKGVRLIGVSTSNLVDEKSGQLTLFDNHTMDKQESIDKVMDIVRARYGHQAIFPGATLPFDELKAQSKLNESPDLTNKKK